MFGLQIYSGGFGRTSKIIEINKISSFQVFSYQQLLHTRFFSNVSLWVNPAVHAQTREITTVCIKTGPWSELILSLGFFTVYVLSSFHSSWQPGKQTNKLSGQIKQVFSLRVPALVNMAVLHRIWGVFLRKKERKKKSLMYEFCLVYIQGEQFHPCLFQPASPIPSGFPSS